MFLVYLRQMSSDVPVRLFDNLADATRFARGTMLPLPESLRRFDVSDPVSIDVVEFDEAGEVKKVHMVREFTEKGGLAMYGDLPLFTH